MNDAAAEKLYLGDCCLTVSGAVALPNGYMHPETFRAIFGEEEYQAMVKRPRVVCEYDE